MTALNARDDDLNLAAASKMVDREKVKAGEWMLSGLVVCAVVI